MHLCEAKAYKVRWFLLLTMAIHVLISAARRMLSGSAFLKGNVCPQLRFDRRFGFHLLMTENDDVLDTKGCDSELQGRGRAVIVATALIRGN